MPELLLELFCEEIPARMQPQARADLQRLVTNGLVESGLTYEGARAFSTPRRITLVVDGLTSRSPDISEERKGPRIGAPDRAIAGFLKAAGLSSADDCETRSDKKGEFYVALIKRSGRATAEILAEVVPDTISKFPWPKSMRWGSRRLRWVRPLHSILCVFDGEIVEFEVDGVASGGATFGHRFMAPGPIEARHFDDYASGLRSAKVMIDPEERSDEILQSARDLAFAQGFDLVEDAALLEENAGLAEWPSVHLGSFDEDFLQVPQEVLTTSMKSHQKCFSVTDPKSGKLANRFVLVSNLDASDGGKAITEGNERVIRARLSDARFFWTQDLKQRLDDLLPKLDEIIFHEKLGTQSARINRLKDLACDLASICGADPAKAARAAELAKADLVTEMVGEFPELQGLMGRYYAEAQGEDPSVAAAIEGHYRPQGPGDAVPDDPVALAVALADKIDTLVGPFGQLTKSRRAPKTLTPCAVRLSASSGSFWRRNCGVDIFVALAAPFARVQGAIERHHIVEQLKGLEELRDHGFSDEKVEAFRRTSVSQEAMSKREELDEIIHLNRANAIDLLDFFRRPPEGLPARQGCAP